MGRPLKKRYFGEPNGTGRLTLTHVWMEDSTEAETGYWVLRQVGSNRYKVTNGDKVGVVRLIDGVPSEPGEGSIEVLPFGTEDVEYAKTIYNRTVTTWQGNRYSWSRKGATKEGEADFIDDAFTAREALAAVLEAETSADLISVMDEYPEAFMSPEYVEIFQELTPSSRQNAVGLGVLEWIDLYGEFETIDDLQDAVDLHVQTEANKQAFIKAVDAAQTVESLRNAFETTLGAVVADRADLIQTFSQGPAPAQERAGELEVEDFTVILTRMFNELADLTDAHYQFILDERNALSGKKFYGTTRMLPVLSDALDLETEE